LRISAEAGAHSKAAIATHDKTRRIEIFVMAWDPGRLNRETVAPPSTEYSYFYLRTYLRTSICELLFSELLLSTMAEAGGSGVDDSECGRTELQPGKYVLPVISRAPRSYVT
jgi:hypothetical protein